MSDSDQSLRIDEPLDALLLMVLKHWALSGHSLLLPCSPLQQLAQTPRVRSSSIRWKAQQMTGMYMGMLCQTTKLCTTCRSGTLLQTYAEQWHTSHTIKSGLQLSARPSQGHCGISQRPAAGPSQPPTDKRAPAAGSTAQVWTLSGCCWRSPCGSGAQATISNNEPVRSRRAWNWSA